MMCPAVSPAGADPGTPSRRSEPATEPSPSFTRAAAASIVGLAPSELSGWERSLRAQAGFDLGSTLNLADLVALAAMGVAAWRLGGRFEEFAHGLAQLFQALRDLADVERLDDHVAIVGRDFARIAELRGDHVRCAGDAFLVIPLAPILASFRDQVFA
jgi:hypothetical protein